LNHYLYFFFRNFCWFVVLISQFNSYSFAKSYGDTIQEKRYREALNVGCEDQKRKNPATAVVL
jgi:hypothetical protein